MEDVLGIGALDDAVTQYLPAEASSEKNLSVKAIAIGGPFVHSSKLGIGALDAVTWDGAAVLESSASRRGTTPGASRFEVAGQLKAAKSSMDKSSPYFP